MGRPNCLVALLSKRLLTTPKDRGSNPIIGIFYSLTTPKYITVETLKDTKDSKIAENKKNIFFFFQQNVTNRTT